MPVLSFSLGRHFSADFLNKGHFDGVKTFKIARGMLYFGRIDKLENNYL